jgi:hypothetical protein
MTSSPPSKVPVTVGELVRRRLKEIKRSSEELAEAVEVPVEYIAEVIAGSRQPMPGRTDVYERMTSFLRLGRNDLLNCIHAEPDGSALASPGIQVRRMLLALCQPATAQKLERRRSSQRGNVEFVDLVRRLLDVAQGAVRRVLDDHIQLRLVAAERGSSYAEMRLRVLDFLDATPGTLTPHALTEFLEPRIALWDVELETGVLRVVLRSWERSRRPAGGRVPLSSLAALGSAGRPSMAAGPDDGP